MILIKKKKALQELAVSLYLIMEFNPDTTSHSIIQRIRLKAQEALHDAAPYTGKLGDNEVQDFLKSRPLYFNIACGRDIIKGDTIRFVEAAYNNKVKPARYLGKRGIIAEVTSVYNASGVNPLLYMRVISSGGTWDIKEGRVIRRYMNNVVHTEVMRTAWENEAGRERLKNELKTPGKVTEPTR